MAGDVAVENAPPMVANDEETVKHTEGNGRYREEVHGGDGFAVIAQEGEPALGRLRGPRSVPHPAGDATLGDLKAEHDEFAVDARSAPRGVLGHHLEDQLADLFGHRPSADRLTHAGDEPPIKLETRPVPMHDGLGLDHDQGIFPRRPEAAKRNPEYFVYGRKFRAASFSLKGGQLLTKREIFNQQRMARAKHSRENTEPKPGNVEHGAEFIADLSN